MLTSHEKAPPTVLALWTSRVALFSVMMVMVSLVLHRLFGLPTPVMLNLIVLGFAGAVLSLLLGAAASFVIWRKGAGGTARIVFGGLVALGLLAWPASAIPTMIALPTLNDVTTHPEQPPPFVSAQRLRPAGANSTQYPGLQIAEVQKVAYPDLKPLVIRRSASETFDVAADAIRRLDMEVVREQPPGKSEQEPGYIEAVDSTLILGFRDDVVIRVYGTKRAARIDVRSASRFGAHDFGRNADRVRAVLKQIVARLEATVTTPPPQKVVPKKKKTKPIAKRKTKKKRKRRRRTKRYRRQRPPQPVPGFFQ